MHSTYLMASAFAEYLLLLLLLPLLLFFCFALLRFLARFRMLDCRLARRPSVFFYPLS